MYKFNEKTLEFIKLHWYHGWMKTIGGYLIILLFVFGGAPLLRMAQTEHEIKIIMAERNAFNEGKLIDLIRNLHFPFPYIVMAQAIHESGNFNSKLFLENNNCLGMKNAMSRITSSQGEQNGYAYYTSWSECIYDRALYSATYLSNVKTEDEYYNFLGQYYAEDKDYVLKLKKIIEQRELKRVFSKD
jgi:hypothetical protein